MIIVVETQYRENYGAQSWDGEGECPQYWKNKGGETYIVSGHGIIKGTVANCSELIVEATIAQITTEIRDLINYKNDGSEEYIIGVYAEDDDYISDYERWQKERDIDDVNYDIRVQRFYHPPSPATYRATRKSVSDYGLNVWTWDMVKGGDRETAIHTFTEINKAGRYVEHRGTES